MPKRSGRKSAAQTPAPKSEQIKGSKKNPKGTASSQNAAKIKLSEKTINVLKNKLEEFEKKYTNKNVSLDDLKAVYRRGSGAYSKSHRPTITGGAPNSRAAWSYARVNKFLEKAAGKPVKKAYVQDDDLLVAEDGAEIPLPDGDIIQLKDGGAVDLYTGKETDKIYVSIKIPYDLNRKEGSRDWEIIYENKKVFEELQRGVLEGVLGVSSSSYNVSDWFISRECLIVMPFDKFIELNNTEQVLYTDVDYLTKNGLDVFFRLYNRKDRDAYAYEDVLSNIFGHMKREFALREDINPNFWVMETIFDRYHSSKFVTYLVNSSLPSIDDEGRRNYSDTDNKGRISSPEDLAKLAAEYVNSRKFNKDYWRSFDGMIDENELIEPITKGFLQAAKPYIDESEWLILDKKLVIPNGSQLFFRVGSYQNTEQKLKEVISEYKLQENYRIYFVHGKYIERLQSNRASKKYKRAEEQFEQLKSSVDRRLKNALYETSERIVADIDKLWTDRVRDSIDAYSPFKDFDGNQYESFFDVPEVKIIKDEILYKIIEILESKIPILVEQKHKYYINQAQGEIENYLNNLISETSGKYFEFADEYGTKFNYYELISPLLRIIGTSGIYFEDYLPEVKRKVGADLYRAYDKKDINMKQGGTVDDIQCMFCSWSWSTEDTDPSDMYVCHQCGADNSLFYDGGILKPTQSIAEIAKKHGVSEEYVRQQLIQGTEHEQEHTDNKEVAEKIALHHLAETPDYYKVLDAIFENNEYGYVDFLKAEKEEAYDVLTCSDTRIFKAMICRAKMDIAKQRMEMAENAEEKNVWNECINIWTDCFNDISQNNKEKFKRGGEPCGCGQKYSKGGLAYGNSHDKGGIPLVVKSTGQNIEIEGGEGVINKRSMQMTKKLDFQGKKMTPCQIISKINEMGGGVKFKCDDVQDIIAEDGHF